MLGNVQNKSIEAVQSQLIFFSVYQSIATHIFVNFVRPHVCWCVSVDVTFYLKWGFVRQGCGFETGSCFWRDMGFSPHLGLRDVGLSLDLGFRGTWV